MISGVSGLRVVWWAQGLCLGDFWGDFFQKKTRPAKVEGRFGVYAASSESPVFDQGAGELEGLWGRLQVKE